MNPMDASALDGRRVAAARWFAIAVAVLLAAVLAGLAAAPANAQFGFSEAGASMTVDGKLSRQAGAHPDFTVGMSFATLPSPVGPRLAGDARTIYADLPPGLLANPNGVSKCPPAEIIGGPEGKTASCEPNAQVGVASVTKITDPRPQSGIPVYNMEAPPDLPALFAFNFLGVVIYIEPSVRPVDHGITTVTPSVSQGLQLAGTAVTFWGVPADPSHDAQRYDPNKNGPGQVGDSGIKSTAAPRPLMFAPTSCEAPLSFGLRADSWQQPGVFVGTAFDADFDGAQFAFDGCERLPFDPSVSVRPQVQTADSPTGLGVHIEVPQIEAPTGLSTSHLKDVRVELPEGLSINPSAANGLAACSDAQLGFGTDSTVACPDAARIGTVTARTPLLDDPLEGHVYVGEQLSDDPESGQMFRMFLTLRGPGVVIKLRGQVRADVQTGRLVTTFVDNPQMPVETIDLDLKDGPTAPLATPASCGPKAVGAILSSWSGKTVGLGDGFDIACGERGFAPSFAAGSLSPTGGAFSPFAVQIGRPDGQQFLSGVSLDMPKGVLAKLAGVELCPDAVAGDGTPGACPEGSRVGTATVAAGAGTPFSLQGPVHLTGPYKGAPFGLAVQVHAKAGPFDLGLVKVRQALHVDPNTAQVRVVSDPLPQVVKGVPIRMRSVDVDIDRQGFTVNPTSCSEKRADVTLTSIDGAVSRASERFQVGDCTALGFTPKLGLRLTGKKQMRSGGHPALRASLTQKAGQANISQAKVTLPKNVVLDSKNAYDPKLLCGYDEALKPDCPASSVIGKASLNTPLLDRRLTGPVHLVQGIRFDKKTGNRIRTLPTLLVKLRGQIAINLRSKTAVDRNSRLVSTFPNVPDARASKFSLQINGGRKGILVVTENRRGRIDLCNAKQTAKIETDGHNGKDADYTARVKTPCATKKKSKRTKR